MKSQNERVLIIFIFLIIVSPVVLLIAYGNYDSLTLSHESFFDTFNNWRWVRFSINISLLTLLASFLFYKCDIDWSSAILSYTTVIMPIIFLILYPGLSQLGLQSDPYSLRAILLLGITHSIGFKLICDTMINRESQINE